MKHYGSKSVAIDPKIKSLLIELNKKGYTTEQSCEGHGYRGYVSFRPKNNSSPYTYLTKNEANDVISIAKKHGCKYVTFPKDINAGGLLWATVTFSSMGD